MYIIDVCNHRRYLFTKLKRHDLPMAQLQSVFDAIVLSRVLYAAPAGRGYLSAEECQIYSNGLLNDNDNDNVYCINQSKTEIQIQVIVKCSRLHSLSIL